MNIQEVIVAWKPYINSIADWKELVAGVTPKATGCGPVYELPNPLNRPNESFAIVDMRKIKSTEPHKHINGEAEIYFVIQGAGMVLVGDKKIAIAKGSIVVTPSETTHVTYPESDLVIACVNTPPFNPKNYVVTP